MNNFMKEYNKIRQIINFCENIAKMFGDTYRVKFYDEYNDQNFEEDGLFIFRKDNLIIRYIEVLNIKTSLTIYIDEREVLYYDYYKAYTRLTDFDLNEISDILSKEEPVVLKKEK